MLVALIAMRMMSSTTPMAVRASSTMPMMRAHLACSRPDRRPPDSSMRLVALLARIRATIPATGQRQVTKPTMAMTSAAVAVPSVCGAAA